MPPPVGTAAELAEEVAALVAAETAVGWERVLDGLVRLHAAGHAEALSVALKPVMHRHDAVFADRVQLRFGYLGEAIRTVLRHQPRPLIRRRLLAAVDSAAHGTPGHDLLPRPDAVLTLRIAEAAVRIAGDPVPELLATPTHAGGAIEAGVLIGRITRAEAEGWEPPPIDVEQALLRVTPTGDPAVRERAAALRSAAGRRLGTWLTAGGLPDPAGARVVQISTGPGGAVVARRAVVDLRPGPGGPASTRLAAALFTLTRPSMPYHDNHWFSLPGGRILAMVLPWHREAAAAWLLPGLAVHAAEKGGDLALLPVLAEAGGPIGPAMTLALTYGLGARHPTGRAAAVDAFLMLAAGPEPFAGRVGAELGDLAADGTVKLNRVTQALAEAHRAGASGAVWSLLRAALPPLLPAAPRGLPDLLELATEVAGSVTGIGEIPELAVVAARRGGSRLVREARRLHESLTRQ